MGIERTDWVREASLLRLGQPTLALFADAPALSVARPWIPNRLRDLAEGHPETAGKLPARLAGAKALRHSTPLPAGSE